MIKKIIFFMDSAFDQRDYERFGIDVMKTNGFEVEVWNFFPFLYPRAYEALKHHTPTSWDGVVSFKTMEDVESGIATLRPDSFVLFIFDLNQDSIPIYKAFTKTSARYGI